MNPVVGEYGIYRAYSKVRGKLVFKMAGRPSLTVTLPDPDLDWHVTIWGIWATIRDGRPMTLVPIDDLDLLRPDAAAHVAAKVRTAALARALDGGVR